MPPSMPWVKIYTEILDDPKVGRLPDQLRWRFIQLIVYAGELDQEGFLPDNLTDAAWRLRDRADQDILADLQALEAAGLAHFDEKAGCWCLTRFAERQGRSQSEKREQWRTRKMRQREKDNVTGDTPVTPQDITPLEEDGDGEEEGEEDKEEEEDKDAQPGSQSEPEPVTEPEPGGALAPQHRQQQDELSQGQRKFLEAFGAKRYKNNTQKTAVLDLEQTYGLQTLMEAITWAAMKGMSLGDALSSIHKALPGWDKPKQGARASPTPQGANSGVRGLLNK